MLHLDLKGYDYPIIDHPNDFTQKLMKMKEKIDQFHLYFYSKKPAYFADKKTRRKESSKLKFNRRHSVMPGTKNFDLLQMVTKKSPTMIFSNEKKCSDLTKKMDLVHFLLNYRKYMLQVQED